VVLPNSFRTSYDALAPSLRVAKEYVQSRLGAEFADLRPVAIQARVKEPESTLAKLQRGELKALTDVDDLVAARLVFLHPAQVHAAVDVARRLFPPVEERNIGEASKPTDFRYQQPHLIVRLPEDYVARHPELAGVLAELQFTTYVQHALQESTHDVIYKGDRFSWQEHRLDARLRGLLEIVDDVLENVSGLAGIATEPEYPLFQRRNILAEVARRLFPEAQLPSDMRRFAVTVEGLFAAAGVPVEQFEALIGRHTDLVDARSLTAVDKVVGMLLREDVEQLVRGLRSRRVLISTELLDLVPEAGRVPQEKRVLL
jgi:ppGpp synthetase/RelA/SpoT-type nucleotidyltranferase